MKKRILIYLIISIVMAGYVVASMRTESFTNSMIMNVCADNDGNIYCLSQDPAYYYISKITQSGTIIYFKKISIASGNYFYTYDTLAVDDSGRLYVHAYRKNSGTYLVYDEQIIQYSASGSSNTVVYDRAFTNPTAIFSAITNISVYKDKLYFYLMSQARDSAQLITISLSNVSNVSKSNTYSIPSDMVPNYIFYSPSTGSGILVDRLARISTLSMFDGSIQILYPSSNENKQTYQLLTYPTISATGILYYQDATTGNYMSMDLRTGGIRIVKQAAEKLNSSISFKDMRTVSNIGESVFVGSTLLQRDGNKYIIYINGNNINFIPVEKYSVVHVLGNFILITIGFFAITIFLELLVSRLMKIKRIPIVAKISIATVPVVILGMVVTYNITQQNVSNLLRNEFYAQIYGLSTNIAKDLDQSLIAQISSPQSYLSGAYNKLAAQVTQTDTYSTYVALKPGAFARSIYGILYKPSSSNQLVVAISRGVQCYIPVDYIYDAKTTPLYYQCYNTGKVVFGTTTDAYGSWMFSLAPVVDNGGNVVGIVEIGVGQKSYQGAVSRYAIYSMLLNLGIGVLTVGAFLLITYLVLKPLRSLRKAVIEISKGNFGVQAHSKAKDEIGEISKAFDKMSFSVESNIKRLTSLNEVSHKFIPSKFFEMLNKNSILDIRLGDHVKEELNIMFVNTRNFFSVSNNMETEDIFYLINDVFKVIAPVVNKGGGIIDRFDTAGVVCLFTSKNENVITTAINIREKILTYNEIRTNRNKKNLDVGISITFGPVMLGIIGASNRISASAISENINFALILDSIGEEFGSVLTVTKSFIKCINRLDSYNYRYIGSFVIQASNEYYDLYDFFDGDVFDVKNKKQITKNEFEEGIMLYRSKQFYEARKKFIEVLKIYREDKAARIYLYRCERFLDGIDKNEETSIIIQKY